MALPKGLSIECFRPDGDAVSNNELESWELKASRRALKNLRTLLVGQPMLDLIAKQMEEGDAYYKSLIAKSDGQWKESRIDLKVKGLKAGRVQDWLHSFAGTVDTPQGKNNFQLTAMVPAHPEHYAIPDYPGYFGVVEIIGRHMCRVRVESFVPLPDFVHEYGNPDFETKLGAIGKLDDGSTFFYCYQEAHDTADGCDMILRLLFPAASPQELLDEHAEHLAVEWKSFIASAFSSCQP